MANEARLLAEAYNIAYPSTKMETAAATTVVTVVDVDADADADADAVMGYGRKQAPAAAAPVPKRGKERLLPCITRTTYDATSCSAERNNVFYAYFRVGEMSEYEIAAGISTIAMVVANHEIDMIVKVRNMNDPRLPNADRGDLPWGHTGTMGDYPGLMERVGIVNVEITAAGTSDTADYAEFQPPNVVKIVRNTVGRSYLFAAEMEGKTAEYANARRTLSITGRHCSQKYISDEYFYLMLTARTPYRVRAERIFSVPVASAASAASTSIVAASAAYAWDDGSALIEAALPSGEHFWAELMRSLEIVQVTPQFSRDDMKNIYSIAANGCYPELSAINLAIAMRICILICAKTQTGATAYQLFDPKLAWKYVSNFATAMKWIGANRSEAWPVTENGIYRGSTFITGTLSEIEKRYETPISHISAVMFRKGQFVNFATAIRSVMHFLIVKFKGVLLDTCPQFIPRDHANEMIDNAFMRDFFHGISNLVEGQLEQFANSDWIVLQHLQETGLMGEQLLSVMFPTLFDLGALLDTFPATEISVCRHFDGDVFRNVYMQIMRPEYSLPLQSLCLTYLMLVSALCRCEKKSGGEGKGSKAKQEQNWRAIFAEIGEIRQIFRAMPTAAPEITALNSHFIGMYASVAAV